MKRAVADRVLREGLERDTLRLAHQTIIELVAAVTRPIGKGPPILSLPEAYVEAEDFLRQFPVICPDEQVVRAALRGMATYGFSWFDAHMSAYAEVNGIRTLLSEDFEHERYYGTVQVVNPFITMNWADSGGARRPDRVS